MNLTESVIRTSFSSHNSNCAVPGAEGMVQCLILGLRSLLSSGTLQVLWSHRPGAERMVQRLILGLRSLLSSGTLQVLWSHRPGAEGMVQRLILGLRSLLSSGNHTSSLFPLPSSFCLLPSSLCPLPSALFLLYILAAPAFAQPTSSPVATIDQHGVVWTPPEDTDAIRGDLRAMQQSGITAARIPFTEDPGLFRDAAHIGIRLYVDLPIAWLPAFSLPDTLLHAERLLTQLASLADTSSAPAVGLTSFVDTSDPRSCGPILHLSNRARGLGFTTYYRTSFINNDACAHTVDFVLVDIQDDSIPHTVGAWYTAHNTPVGINLILPDVTRSDGGYRAPGSAASQARFLENALNEISDQIPRLPVLFTDNWDHLHARDRSPYLARDVLAGFYTGTQTVFAIDAGEHQQPLSFLNVVGWLTAFLLALLLGMAPRFRQLFPDYFTRHGHYREIIQRNAGLEPLATLGTVLTLALSAGIAFTSITLLAQPLGILDATMARWPNQASEVVRQIISRPAALILLVSLLYGLWILVNMLWMALIAGGRYQIRPLQASILAVFSRWPLVLLATGSVLLLQYDPIRHWVFILPFVWIWIEVVAAARMMYDFSRITHTPASKAMVTGYVGPLFTVIIAAIIIAATTAVGPTLTFIQNLATRV